MGGKKIKQIAKAKKEGKRKKREKKETHIARKVKKNHFFVSEKKSLKLIKISDFLLPI